MTTTAEGEGGDFPAIHDPKEAMDRLFEAAPEISGAIVHFELGSCILEEGQENDTLYILCSGEARLSKLDTVGSAAQVGAFFPGSLLGLTSFWARQKTFASILAATPVDCVSIDRAFFEELTRRNPRFTVAMQSLFVSNLTDRYRHLAISHVERARLSRELESERNQLKDTVELLESATKRLIHQEKLATMGQLMAGIAHEINNPAGALIRGIETASESLGVAFQNYEESVLVEEGLACPFWSSEEKRGRMARLEKRYPKIERTMIRRLAQLTDRAFRSVEPMVEEGGGLGRALAIYEVAMSFRGARISARRIEQIVKGLKNYGRGGDSGWSLVDLREGIQDTLTVLNNRLKRYELQLPLDPAGPVSCNVGEINQVWTNLLVNAMDATPEGGALKASSFIEGKWAVVRVDDGGKGIAPDKLLTVFEPNYTTKNQSGSFGLGLGLAISKDIVVKHGGQLTAGKSDLGGARFEVRLPLA